MGIQPRAMVRLEAGATVRDVAKALRVAAPRQDAITAPWVIDGPINGGILRTCVQEVLAPL